VVDTTVILKYFDKPDEVTVFQKGRFETVCVGGLTIGRATYEPGWRWSHHIGSLTGKRHCTVEHVGLVISGHATAAMQNGAIYDLIEGTIFYIPGEPHDSWVVGDEPYVSLHFLGADKYSK